MHYCHRIGYTAKMIDGYKAQIADLDVLAQSIFVDTFGNVAVNDKCWDIIQMGQLGNFKNGLNYSKGEIGKPLKIIGVGDFQTLNVFLHSTIYPILTLKTFHKNICFITKILCLYVQMEIKIWWGDVWKFFLIAQK